MDFMRISGGVWASSTDPPAFARAEAQRELMLQTQQTLHHQQQLEGGPHRLALPAPPGLVMLEGNGAVEEARLAAIAAGDVMPWGEEGCGNQQGARLTRLAGQKHGHGGGMEDQQTGAVPASGSLGIAGRGGGSGGRRGVGCSRGRNRGVAQGHELEQEVQEEVGRLEETLEDMREFYTHHGSANEASRDETSAMQLQQPSGRSGGEESSQAEPSFGASLMGYGAASLALARTKASAFAAVATKAPNAPLPATPSTGTNNTRVSPSDDQRQGHIVHPAAASLQPGCGADGGAACNICGTSLAPAQMDPKQQQRQQQQNTRVGIAAQVEACVHGQAPAADQQQQCDTHMGNRRSERGDGSCDTRAAAAGKDGGQCLEEGEGVVAAGPDDEVGRDDAPESLSDLDDAEIDCYLATAEERRRRELLWTQLNKDWLEGQASKTARHQQGAGQAGTRRRTSTTADARGGRVCEDDKAGAAVADSEPPIQGVADQAADAEGMTEPADSTGRKTVAKRGAKRPRSEVLPEADSAADAARAMLHTKKLSDKINYKTLESLFEGVAAATTAPSAAFASSGRSSDHRAAVMGSIQHEAAGGAAAEAMARHEEARSSAALQAQQRLRSHRSAMEQQRGGAGADLMQHMLGAGRATPVVGASSGKRLGSLPGKRLHGLGPRRN